MEKTLAKSERWTTPLDINAMALFARVLQHGSLSEASRRLGVPVSTVSREISALESQLCFRRVIRYRHVLVAAPSYLANAGRLSHPADLRKHRLLGFSKWFDDVSWKLSDGHVTERIPLKPWLGINDYAGVIRAAVSGMGVAEIPSILCGRELHQGLLVA